MTKDEALRMAIEQALNTSNLKIAFDLLTIIKPYGYLEYQLQLIKNIRRAL